MLFCRLLALSNRSLTPPDRPSTHSHRQSMSLSHPLALTPHLLARLCITFKGIPSQFNTFLSPLTPRCRALAPLPRSLRHPDCFLKPPRRT